MPPIMSWTRREESTFHEEEEEEDEESTALVLTLTIGSATVALIRFIVAEPSNQMKPSLPYLFCTERGLIKDKRGEHRQRSIHKGIVL